MAGSSSSSSSSSSTLKYHVFISFRGEDTRKTFTSHLYHAFSINKIKAYIDEQSLKKGDEISPALLEAIEMSKISIVVLSENYASSRWCLDELNHILRCKDTMNQIVVPIFYHVDPSHVQKQQGSYGKAFAAHEVRFQDQMDKVQQWRNSLTTVSNLPGFDSSNFGSDSKLVEEILQYIMKKLYSRLPCHDYSKHLVGIEKRIEQVESMLNISSSDVRIVGIWGMGGIGKTTLARVIFDHFASTNQFEGCCFLDNVKATKRHKLAELQLTFFSQLLREENIYLVNQFVKDRLRRTKVLVVLDDIDDYEQLEYLAGNHDWFGAGSRIIVTTRNMGILTFIPADATYEVEKLDSDEALHLFCSKAFRRNSPTTDYADLSRRAVIYAKGIPLALNVLGRHLFTAKSINEWESALDKLKKDPDKKIQTLLRISFDGLDEDEQQIFLDIACFYRGEREKFVKRILSSLGRYVDIGMRVLIDKSLITVDSFNRIGMHDLLQQMGQRIVREESNMPGERSRLWSTKDVCQVLKYNTGTEAIQGISLETSADELRDIIHVDPGFFNQMYNLKYLKFLIEGDQEYLHFPEGLECLPDELRYLFWLRYPLKFFPPMFKAANLVELHMPSSKLEHLWEGVPDLANLKNLDLRHSINLIQIPNLSRAVNLEWMILSGCTGLKNFDEFSELPVNLKHLTMSSTSIKEVSPSFERLCQLENLDLSYCEKLKSLLINICKLKSLRRLDLYNCVELKSFPEILEPMEHLTDVELSETSITKLPSSIENLVNLKNLRLSNCKNLQLISNNVHNMPIPSFDSCVSEIPSEVFCLPLLESLFLSMTWIRTIPESIKYSKLHSLQLIDCESLESLPELPFPLEVYASGCKSLQKISNSSVEIVSKTSLLTEVPDHYKTVYYREQLQFVNCPMLDPRSIIAEFQIRALSLGTAILSIQKQTKLCMEMTKSFHTPTKTCLKDCKITITFPGDEVPKWFDFRNDNGCLIKKMKLVPPHSYDTTNFMGFASCVVVSCEPNGKGFYDHLTTVSCSCDINVETNNGQNCLKFHMYLGFPETYSGTNQVVMWYFHGVEIDLFSAEEISFNFHIDDNYEGRSIFRVERCGIRMLQLQDAEEFGIIRGEFVHAESNVVTNELEPSGVEIVDLETNEQLPKRAKFSS